MLAVLVINHRTLSATLSCLTATLPELPLSARIHLLDNGSGGDDVAQLDNFCRARTEVLRFEASAENLGFAAGMNRLLRGALADAEVEQILLLNSDARPMPGFIAAMQRCLAAESRTDMVAARMLDAASGEADSLGITLFRSTLASNRKRDDEILLGPSGGCALLTRRLLEDMHANHGEWFDETFFCYAEDTDFAVRARWLGYLPAYAADAVVRHERSLSSGGPDNDFVLYHGIRNSLWWLAKDAPLGWFLRSLPYFIALHVGIWLRHLRKGRARVLWRLYRDAVKGLPAMRRKRAQIQATRRVAVGEFARWVEPRFYQRDYVRGAWRELWTGKKPER